MSQNQKTDRRFTSLSVKKAFCYNNRNAGFIHISKGGYFACCKDSEKE